MICNQICFGELFRTVNTRSPAHTCQTQFRLRVHPSPLPTSRSGELSAQFLPFARVGCQFPYVGFVNTHQHVFWFNVRVNDFTFVMEVFKGL